MFVSCLWSLLKRRSGNAHAAIESSFHLVLTSHTHLQKVITRLIISIYAPAHVVFRIKSLKSRKKKSSPPKDWRWIFILTVSHWLVGFTHTHLRTKICVFMTDICLGIVNNLDREQEYACLTKFRLYFCILFWDVFHFGLGCWPHCCQRCRRWSFLYRFPSWKQ